MLVSNPVFAGMFAARAVAAATRLAAILATPIHSAVRRHRIRRTADLLAGLDDRLLADIGLRRSQVTSIAMEVVDRPYVDPRRVSM